MRAITPQILLLDDEPDNLELLQRTLRAVAGPAGIELFAFTEPAQALAWCRSHEPDLCLVDQRMPQMTGVQFLKTVRAFPGFEAVPMVMITGSSEGSVRREALLEGAVDFITKPFDIEELRMRLRNLLAVRCGRLSPRDTVARMEAVSVLHEGVDLEHERIIHKLTRLSCSRDEETGNHMRRVAYLAQLVAQSRGLPADYCDLILLAAPLHDIGKVGIPDRILLKPGRLDAAEWEVMKTHARIGHELLKDSASPVLRMGADIAIAHHEKFDGSGYPNGLRGEDIPLAGRIVAAVDAFDALLSVRPYKRAWSAEDALEYLRRNAGTHFDPLCVEILLDRRADALSIEQRYADEIRNFANDQDIGLNQPHPVGAT